MSRYATTKADVYFLGVIVALIADSSAGWLLALAWAVQEVIEWRYRRTSNERDRR